jgi:tetratricopeptide (TPR) repeat protein
MMNCRFSQFRAIVFAGASLLSCVSANSLDAQSQEAARNSPSNPPLLAKNITSEDRGDLLMVRGSYQAAIDAYNSCPFQSAAVLNKIGIAYHHMYAIDKARMSYEGALHLNPEFADALNNLGAAYYAEKNFGKAEQYYRKALKYAPRDVTYRKNLGTAYFAEGDFRKGIAAYRAAFLDDPDAFNDDSNLVSGPTTMQERANQDYCLAALFAEAGINLRAIDYLQKAFSSGFTNFKKLTSDPDFALLRTTPEFVQLMKDEGK